MKILIDPAHGGSNYGHVTESGLMEKQATLACANVLCLSLGRHFLTVLTRIGDDDLSHTERAKMASDSDLTISLHFHAAGNPHLRQVEAWARSRTSEAISRLILDRAAKTTGEGIMYRQTMNRITHGTKPVVLLMGGFISNPDVEQAVVTGQRFKELADAVTDALLAHVGSNAA